MGQGPVHSNDSKEGNRKTADCYLDPLHREKYGSLPSPLQIGGSMLLISPFHNGDSSCFLVTGITFSSCLFSTDCHSNTLCRL